MSIATTAAKTRPIPLARTLRWALDPVCFAVEALGITPDPWQADVLRGRDARTLLNCSRQSGKSTIASILAAHHAVYVPNSLTLLISPSQRQSSELFAKIHLLLQRLDVLPRRAESARTSVTLPSGARIVSLPCSESTIRGFSAVDLLIEDEASRVDDGLYLAVRPILAVSQGRLLLMSTPFGQRGHFYESWTDLQADWVRIEIPASHCPRIAPAFLREERRTLGEFWYQQEYMCQFQAASGALFSPDALADMFREQALPAFAAAS
jgi:hypothetical protein